MQTRQPNPVHSSSILAIAMALAIATTITIVCTATPSSACVGRKLVLGSLETDRPAMVARILSILIHERTGTTVEVKFFHKREKLLSAVTRDKVDLYVDYVDNAAARMEITGAADGKEKFKAVKQHFEEELNLVWLKPMGYSGIDPDGASLGSASVVVAKDTLKIFPALPRLLEKIGSRVVLDDTRLDSLVSKAKAEKAAKVARRYLKEVKLI